MYGKEIRQRIERLIKRKVPYKTIKNRLGVTEYLVCAVAKEMQERESDSPPQVTPSNLLQPERVEAYICPGCGKEVWFSPCVVCAALKRMEKPT